VKDGETATFMSLEVWTLAIGMVFNVVGVTALKEMNSSVFFGSLRWW
jgi:hypothetical protein